VRRYLRYLDLSYQTLQLPAWAGNPGVRLIKAPKLVWFDSGVQRALSGEVGGLRGHLDHAELLYDELGLPK
jgi:predicted AAA+ superfamily ATPase